MKRLLISAVAILLMTGNLHATNFGFGLRGGINFSSLPSAENFQVNQHRYHALSDSYTGFHLGIMSQIVLPGFYIMPELLYTRTGLEMRREDMGTLPMEDLFFTQTYNSISLPITAGAMLGPFRIGAGPVFSFFLDESTTFPDELQFQQQMNDFVLGLQAGIGLNLGNLVLDFKYQTSFTNFGERVEVNGSSVEFDTRPHQFILSIGLLF